MRTASANRMMEAILSNDDEDWHSHFDRGVKEASLDWYSRYIANGGARSGDRGSATRYRSIAETPAGRGSTGNGRRRGARRTGGLDRVESLGANSTLRAFIVFLCANACIRSLTHCNDAPLFYRAI
jgi:hypothetical protein